MLRKLGGFVQAVGHHGITRNEERKQQQLLRTDQIDFIHYLLPTVPRMSATADSQLGY